MSPIYHEKSILELIKRESNDTFTNPFFDSSTGSAWIWGRWVLFGVFGILGIIIVILGTLKINRGRNKIGQAPIRGTAWMTPPSYRQSEIQYTGNAGKVVEEYVPKYTRNANNQDLGYYDERGEFHQNNDAEYIAPPTLEPTTNSSIPQPAPAIVHESSSEEFNMTRDFERTFNNPEYNIPSRNTNLEAHSNSIISSEGGRSSDLQETTESDSNTDSRILESGVFTEKKS